MSEVMKEADRINDEYEIKLYCRPSDEELRKMDEELYLEEGFNNGRNEVILNMHKDNVPIETIAKYTNLSCEEVNKIILEKESK